MEKKYIIKLEENEIAYKTVNSNGCPMIGLLHPAPYTEPDLEQVRKEAYEEGYAEGSKEDYDEAYLKGYNQGLSDAWECARKIVDCTIPYEVLENYLEIGECTADVIKHLPASKAIEVVRQYEQEKEEIQVGDEVISEDDIKATVIDMDDYLLHVLDENGVVQGWPREDVAKTDRHFPEIAAVLEKMREE